MTGRHEMPPAGTLEELIEWTRAEGMRLGLIESPEDVRPVCDRCHMPAALVDGRWQHAEAADAAFCQLVMRGGET